MKFESKNLVFDNEAKILQLNPFMIYVRAFDEAENHSVNCIVAKHALTFFYELQKDSRLALYGHYNRKKQFVINKYMIQRAIESVAI